MKKRHIKSVTLTLVVAIAACSVVALAQCYVNPSGSACGTAQTPSCGPNGNGCIGVVYSPPITDLL